MLEIRNMLSGIIISFNGLIKRFNTKKRGNMNLKIG